MSERRTAPPKRSSSVRCAAQYSAGEPRSGGPRREATRAEPAKKRASKAIRVRALFIRGSPGTVSQSMRAARPAKTEGSGSLLGAPAQDDGERLRGVGHLLDRRQDATVRRE